MLQPVRRRTWAPRGRTPIHYSWDRHDRISAIAAITVSPVRRRLDIAFDLHRRNVRSEAVVPFLTALHHRLRRRFIVVLDKYSVHQKAIRLLRASHPEWLEAEWLPSYAPDLNPVEQVWNNSKYGTLANFLPEDLDHLERELTIALFIQSRTQHLLRSFFAHAKLGL